MLFKHCKDIIYPTAQSRFGSSQIKSQKLRIGAFVSSGFAGVLNHTYDTDADGNITQNRVLELGIMGMSHKRFNSKTMR